MLTRHAAAKHGRFSFSEQVFRWDARSMTPFAVHETVLSVRSACFTCQPAITRLLPSGQPSFTE